MESFMKRYLFDARPLKDLVTEGGAHLTKKTMTKTKTMQKTKSKIMTRQAEGGPHPLLPLFVVLRHVIKNHHRRARSNLYKIIYTESYFWCFWKILMANLSNVWQWPQGSEAFEMFCQCYQKCASSLFKIRFSFNSLPPLSMWQACQSWN